MTRTDDGHEFRCPLCHGAAGDLYLRSPGHPDWDIVRCRACGFLSLRKPPAPDALAAFYQEDYYRETDGSRFAGPFETAARAFRRQRAHGLRRWLPAPPAAILDVGCGRGIFLATMHDWGYDVHGTQLSATAAAYARRAFGIDVFVGELEQAPYPDASFDLVTLWHVLEHLSEPRAALERIHRLLKPGGQLLVEVPNAASWTARWGGHRWLHWDVPRHLGHFTPETLTAVLKAVGFEVVSRSFFSLEYGPFGVIQTLLNFLPGAPNRFFDGLKGGHSTGAAITDPNRSKPEHQPVGVQASACPVATPVHRAAGRRGAGFFLHAALAAILAVPALVYSAVAAACGQGDILTLRCRKR